MWLYNVHIHPDTKSVGILNNNILLIICNVATSRCEIFFKLHCFCNINLKGCYNNTQLFPRPDKKVVHILVYNLHKQFFGINSKIIKRDYNGRYTYEAV